MTQFLRSNVRRKFALLILAVLLSCITIVTFIETDSRDNSFSSSHKRSQIFHENKKPHRFKKEKLYQFPQGGRALFPSYRLVALYGTPDNPLLGSLGEQGIDETIMRVKQLADQYKGLTKDKIFPTLEIIATIASASPTDNGDFSSEQPIELLEPLIKTAKNQGVYVILDLQSGRSDFLTQAKRYESLLREPNVGLALDPEWRLGSDEVHLQQIGSVGIDEVNATSQWLANFTKTYELPQKIFLLHQFRLSMIQSRERFDTSHQELAYVIQMDGQGAQPTKQETWNTIIANAPPNTYFGWKNFYDEDMPMLTPEQTMQITPLPQYVSYQ